jgi:hypothetical protein
LPLPPSAVVEHFVAPGVHCPVHAPPTHAWLLHADGVPQLPAALQVDTALSEPPSAPVAHSVEFGAQTPWHDAVPEGPPHAWLAHVVAVPHVPVAVQVWIEELPAHCVCPGAHTPVQDAVPLVTRHVEFEQVEGVPHVPDEEHVATALRGPPSAPVAHSVAPGEQLPVHAAWRDPGVVSMVTHAWLTQAAGLPQLPLLSHVWREAFPEHCVFPGVQVPLHTAPAPPSAAQTPVEHATAVPQLPLESHVWTPCPEHWVVPGTHEPTQFPPTQAEAAQATGAP